MHVLLPVSSPALSNPAQINQCAALLLPPGSACKAAASHAVAAARILHLLHLQVPRKAWPGLLRMPDLAGCAGSPEAVEAFVTLVRR
jgi:hypothetical protein